MILTEARFKFTMLAIACTMVGQVHAQWGSMDETFNAGDVGYDCCGGANNVVEAVAAQGDGKMLLAGDFTIYNGTASNRIVRLNVDGSVDTTFLPGAGANGLISVMVLQSDGKILIGGLFTSYDGTSRKRIARINPDGSPDLTFNPGMGANNWVRAIAVQTDGRILIGGHFTNFNGTSQSRIVRLNSDGSLDTGFTSGTGANAPVNALVVSGDTAIYMGGEFTAYNGSQTGRIARLTGEGIVDGSFASGTGPSAPIMTMAMQSDGKVLIGGSFSGYNGTTLFGIARISLDGGLDATFDVGTGTNSRVNSVEVLSDGKVLIGGNFTSFNGITRRRIARLGVDGSLDSTFVATGGSGQPVLSIAATSDGNVLMGGSFTSYSGLLGKYFARLLNTGEFDTSIFSNSGANATVSAITMVDDGMILFGGDLISFNGTTVGRIGMLQTEGILASSFAAGYGANSSVSALEVQDDGKILITGNFSLYDSTSARAIARIEQDGTLDVSFISPFAIAGPLVAPRFYDLALDEDQKIVVVGNFATINGSIRNRIARFNADGSFDQSFIQGFGTGANDIVATVAIQSDGKILIGGRFTTFNSVPVPRIARLDPDGSLDTLFNVGTGANNWVTSIVVQDDGKILVGGWFNDFDQIPRNRIVRLNTDGSVDASFDPGTGADAYINTMVLANNGRILIGGEFSSYNGVARGRIAQLNGDGSLDTAWDPGSGANGEIKTIAVQPDGNVLIGGSFTAYDGIGRNRIARILGCGAVNTSVTLTGGTLTTEATDASFQWLDCDMGFSSLVGANEQEYEPPVSGTYAVSVTQNGCTAVSDCFEVVSSGISEPVSNTTYSVDPNPIASEILIQGTRQLYKATLTLYNTLGQPVRSFSDLSGGTLLLQRGDAPAGIYLLRLEQDGSTLLTKKVVLTD
jgi:uncharacterized delta-60 repeat protein